MHDIDVRNALWEQLGAAHAGEDDTRLLDEFGLELGDVRVNVVVIDGEIHGYASKSERDALTRLPRQVAAYGAALDRATLVVAEGRLVKASALVPEWWGLSIAHSVGGSAVRVEAHRFTARNPEPRGACVTSPARSSTSVSRNALRLTS
ncbi:hypothetical protein MXAN_6135 [Myxococcus xanthus DK 1622]|uniref:Uncharacterized protein n=1 Tax=Myxococcus xanthus (strain DK1622) TaxID=246197 RepID=Q1CZA5_MYXXD|nr:MULTISPECIES: sce7726 family protein [Myxococcus]ABF89343.1 hypothetical protein MXAN_6135 [Myxococcus xanthus DK 1622]UYI13436.1 sce7726 family protein [Myxococcus xanthus]UYI20803.1 sce7726 family protein [Myxococcus xanthus]